MDYGTFALREPVFLVLLSLAEHPRHGYAILKDVESMSGGRVLLSTGRLYGALRRSGLHRLEYVQGRWMDSVESNRKP
jgi:DNA-binding PadR family transcriptional regulator